MSFVWESAVFSIIAFGILYFLLNKYAFKPLFGLMEKRSDHIQDQLQTAETNRIESEKLLAEQTKLIAEARKSAYDIIEQSRVTSTKQADEIINQAKNEASRQKEDALRDIESEKNKAIVELRNQVSELSIFIASKIVEKQVDEQSQKQIIEQYLKQVGGRA